MTIAITGAGGFIGGHVVARLVRDESPVRALGRDPARLIHLGVPTTVIPSLEKSTDRSLLKDALADCSTLVHLAAKVHAMNGGIEEEFFDINVDGSLRLMEGFADAGGKRFVFLSSIKAVGERTEDEPFSDGTTPKPEDGYGRSKLAAEIALKKAAEELRIRFVCLRPTFVYGAPATGNFRTVIAAIRRGIPLPLASIRNRRDIIYVGNLADAIAQACFAENLSAEPYFVSDGAPVATPDLFRAVGKALDRPARLFPFPLWALSLAGRLVGRGPMIARLSENLEAHAHRFCRDAGWHPPYKMSEGLSATAEALLNEKHGKSG